MSDYCRTRGCPVLPLLDPPEPALAGAVHLGAWLLVGGVMLVSAGSKLRSRAAFEEFAGSVAALRLLRPRWNRPAAVAVALAEAAVVVLLAVPPLATAGFLLGGVLLVVFTVAVVLALRRGTTAPCRCFGGSTRPFSRAHVVRNGLLLSVVVVALASSPPVRYDPAAVAVGAFAAVVGVIVVLFFVDFVALFAGTEPYGAARTNSRSTSIAPAGSTKRNPGMRGGAMS